jgi:hypothetical protein
LFLEPEFSELLEIAEDELVDDYHHNDLTPAERSNFEAKFLTERPQYESNYPLAAERERSLLIARVLKEKLEQPVAVVPPPVPAPTPSWFERWFGSNGAWWRIPLVAAALLLVIIGGWLIVRSLLHPRESARPQEAQTTPGPRIERSAPGPVESPTPDLSEERVQQTNTPPPVPLPKTRKPKRKDPDELVAALDTDVSSEPVVRGDSLPNPVEYGDAKAIKIHMSVIDEIDGKRPQAVLRSYEGSTILRFPRVRIDRKTTPPSFAITVPTDKVPPGKYQVDLSGLSPSGGAVPIHSYYFFVKPSAPKGSPVIDP